MKKLLLLLKRIYCLNIKSSRGRDWLGLFWFGVFLLFIFPLLLADNAPSSGLVEGPIIIIIVSYIFALVQDSRSVQYKSKYRRGDVTDTVVNSVENTDTDETYLGEYKDNKKDGQGTMTWNNGEKYEGEWKDDKRHGQGTMTWNNGQKYEGEWKDDKRHGQGKNREGYGFGDEYNGEWKDDKMHGQGTRTWSSSGNKYVGEWKDDKMHGQGSLTVNSASALGLSSSVEGKILNGHFENNKFLRELTKTK